jgi:hypothetical protein
VAAEHAGQHREDLGDHATGPDVELYDSYREMAAANSVEPDDPALTPYRGDRHVARLVPGTAGTGTLKPT